MNWGKLLNMTTYMYKGKAWLFRIILPISFFYSSPHRQIYLCWMSVWWSLSAQTVPQDNPCWTSYLFSIAFQQLDPGMVEQYEWALRRKEKHTWADHGSWTAADRHRNSEHTFGNCWRKGARRLSASSTFTSPVPGNGTNTAQCSRNVVRIYNQLPKRHHTQRTQTRWRGLFCLCLHVRSAWFKEL